MKRKIYILVSIFFTFILAFAQNISIEISPTIWDIYTIYYGDSVSMDTFDVIKIVNIDTLPVDLSIGITSITPGWIPGMDVGINTFVLRAEFTSTSSPPSDFSPIQDYLNSYIVPATDERFGPDGYNISPNDTQFLYFQFISPIGGFLYYDTSYTICADIHATYHLPPEDTSAADTTVSVCVSGNILYNPSHWEAPGIEIESTYCGADSGFIQIKSLIPIAFRDTAEVQFYMLYRTQWAPFTWDDLNIIPPYSDSMWIIDPIEDWDTHIDPDPAYRWYTFTSTRDEFSDTVWNREDIWGIEHCTKGVCDPNVNWYYVCVATDSTPMPYRFSWEPSRPVGEFDQWIVNGGAGTINIISYAVSIDINGADTFAQKIPNCVCLAEWDAESQDTITLAKKVGGSWVSYGTVEVGRAYIAYVDSSAPDSVLFSLYKPGYIPYDTDVCPDEQWCFLDEPSDSTGFDIFAVPYQEYNTLLGIYGSFPIPARLLGDDMPPDLNITQIALWNPETQSADIIAYDSSGLWVGDKSVYPGEALMVCFGGNCGNLKINEYFVPQEVEISVSPNPFNSSCKITINGVDGAIYDLQGNMVYKFPIRSTSDARRIIIWHPDKTITSGIYFVRATINNGRIMTKQIVYLK